MEWTTGLDWRRWGVGFWVTASHWLTANDEHETDSLTSTLHSQTLLTTDAARGMLYCLPTRQVPSVRCFWTARQFCGSSQTSGPGFLSQHQKVVDNWVYAARRQLWARNIVFLFSKDWNLSQLGTTWKKLGSPPYHYGHSLCPNCRHRRSCWWVRKS